MKVLTGALQNPNRQGSFGRPLETTGSRENFVVFVEYYMFKCLCKRADLEGEVKT